MNQNNKKIYHYTNIDSLEKIIENKSMKFNRLDNMDDPLEYISYDIDFCKGIYISSWTDNAKEDIGMWSMYTNPNSAVRIELTDNPFYTITENLDNFFLEADKVTHKQGPTVRGLTFRELANKGLSLNPPFVPNLIEVEYVSNKVIKMLLDSVCVTKINTELLPNGQSKRSLNQSFKLNVFGEFKLKEWSFQKEWRYKITLLPCTNDEMLSLLKVINEKQQLLLFDWLKDKYNTCINFPDSIFIDIKNSAFDNMIVTIGPNVSEENKKRIQEIVEKSGFKIKVKNSDLRIRFKHN